MSELDVFLWGLAVGTFAMHLLNRAYERILQRRLEVAQARATQLQQQLDERRATRDELLAARVEVAFDFAAMKQAARDVVRS